MGSSSGKFSSIIFDDICSSLSSSSSYPYSRGIILTLSMNAKLKQVCVCSYASLICSNMLDNVAGSFLKSCSFDFL